MTRNTSTRKIGTRAKAELERRGLSRQPVDQKQPEPGSERPTTARWWHRVTIDLAAVEAVFERRHQPAIAASRLWLPHRNQRLQAKAVINPEPDDRATRLDELLGHAAEVAKRLAVENAEHEAAAEYSARIGRASQADLEPTLTAQDQAEAEL